jgi:hypothetical protein
MCTLWNPMTRRRIARRVMMTLLTAHYREGARRNRKPCLADSKTAFLTMDGSTQTQRARSLCTSNHPLKLPTATTLVAIGEDFVPTHQSRLDQTDSSALALRTTTELQKALQSDRQIFQCTHKIRGPLD